jgi:hypothetical protein
MLVLYEMQLKGKRLKEKRLALERPMKEGLCHGNKPKI